MLIDSCFLKDMDISENFTNTFHSYIQKIVSWLNSINYNSANNMSFLKMRFHLLFLALSLSVALFAQNEDFASDRPGLSDSPDLIRKNSWQIATGFDISKYNHYGLYQLSASTLKFRNRNML